MTVAQSTAIVAGAAGDIGQSTCQLLRQRGLRVVGVDLRPDPGGFTDEWIVADAVNQRDSDAQAVADRLSTRSLAHLITIIGGTDPEELAQSDLAHVPLTVVRRTIELNLVSAFTSVRWVIDSLREASGDRSITFVSSVNAYGGWRAPAYSAAKAGLGGLVRSLADPLGREGVRINAVALGTTRTANYIRISRVLRRTLDFASLGRNIPLGSVLSPDQAAEAIGAVALDLTGLTGQVVVVDGGQTLVRP